LSSPITHIETENTAERYENALRRPLAHAGAGADVAKVDTKLEVVVISVSDVAAAGRIDAAQTAFASTADLASALRRAAAAHGEHEKRTGQPDANWPDWYAAYMVAEQAGEELPS